MHDTEIPPAAGFTGLGLRPELLSALTRLGYEEPTPVQQEAIPVLLAGRDLLGQAETGTGKTAAFALPLLQGLPPGRDRTAPAALVLVPTRELALQVSEALHRYGRDLGARVLPVYGGTPIGRQIQGLRRGVDVVVATPGRALDLLRRRSLALSELAVVVLDEADEMLDMGFAEDLEAILATVPETAQTALFSATMPARIDAIARRRLRDPARIQLRRAETEPGEAPRVREAAFVVPREHKAAALCRVLDVEAPTAAIVFCRTREEVDRLTETLTGRGQRAEALHGGMGQPQRDRVMSRLRAGTAELLVATDVAARGLDIDQLTHVVNYDVPQAAETYVHRIGRVGRAGREGVAITLAQPREQRMLKAIERLTGRRIAVAPVPTVKELRAKRVEALADALRERAGADDLDRYRPALDALSAELGFEQVALAAIALAADATGGSEDTTEIPGQHTPAKPGKRERAERRAQVETTKVFIGAGSEAGIRREDLVGAITGESALVGRDIGAIQVSERFSLVEVPEEAADAVIAALRASTLKGRNPKVRRERFGAPGKHKHKNKRASR